MRFRVLWIGIILSLAGCNLASASPTAPAITVSPIVVTATPQEQLTVATTQAPQATSTVTNTPTPSHTPTVTNTPTVTSTPSITPTASITPAQPIFFNTDRFDLATVPEFLQQGSNTPLIVFANSNDRATVRNASTAQPENTRQIVYVTSPGSLQRTQILEIQSSDGNRFYPAPNGVSMAYFVSGLNAGLYVLNFAPVEGTTFTARLWTTSTLIQRGILSEPVWTPDGAFIAIAQQTAYDMDIFFYSRDTRQRLNITDHPSFDMYPSFSPDGRYMAFVSDRATCASWNPADDGACDALTQETPIGGTVHLLDRESGAVRQLADVYVTEAPRWLSNTRLVFAGGDQTDLLNPSRSLWLADITTNAVEEIRLTADLQEETVLYLADAWSDDGQQVVFQRVTTSSNEIILADVNGNLVARPNTDLSFPRFGVRIDWNTVAGRIAIGGTGGRCPYGVRVVDTNLEAVATGTNPSICDPIYSPDGGSLVFTGLTSDVDGQSDIYSATANGFSSVNLTADLRGTNVLIGWLGTR